MNPNDFFDLVNKYKKQNAMQSSASGKATTSSRGGSQPFPYLVDQYKKEEEEKMRRYVASFDSNDIAPFSSKDDERVGKWFKKGALEDGFSLKGLGKNIVGTWQDIDRNVTAAVFDATEALIDTHAYGAGMIGGLFDKGFQDDVGNFIAKDLLNPTTGEVDSEGNPVRVSDMVSRWGTPSGIANNLVNQNNTEANSFFGDNMDGMVQSTAHMVGSKALERLGVPGWLTQGVNAFGGELEQAFQNNATFRQAGISASVSAVAEAITERLSSGIKFKGASLDDGLQTFLKTGIENKLIRTILKYESDIVGEGLEEVASEALSSLGRKFTYMKDEDWSEVLSLESLFDAFVGGALMGMGFGGANIVKSKASGVDATSGLTANEEKVVNKLYEDEVAKRKAEGNLKAGDKTKIYDKLVQDMQKGYIETDVIESVLGGDSYSAYRDAVNNESRQKKLVDALIKESDKLEDIPTNQLTGKQQLRRDELRSIIPELQNQIRNNENSTNRKDLKSKLENEVMNMVRGDRLSESYAEKARVYQKLDIDPETFSKAKHADAAKQTVASAVELGANNTNRVRDLVEHAAQISGKTGKAFFFKDNDTIKNDFVEKKTKTIEKYEQMENRTAEQNKALAELKQLVEDVKSGKKVINGENTADGIVLNIDSKNPLMVTVGHEVTHDTENAKSYDKMKKALFAYASTKGIDVQTRIAMAKMVYEGTENANAEQEVVADLVGEMLFTDDAFVDHLARTDTNVFQNLWNDIKNLVKMATPGSKEAKELANLEHKFEKAFKEANKAKKATDAETQYKISGNPDFNSEEWSIVNRRKYSEFYNPKYFLDESYNWMYAKEKGYTVFAIYSKNDPDDPTVLYGTGGKNADKEYKRLTEFLEEVRNRENDDRSTYDRFVSDLRNSEGDAGTGLLDARERTSTEGDVFLPIGQSQGYRGRNFGYGEKDFGKSWLTENFNEASEESDASVTFSNDYQAWRNLMKDGDTGEDSGSDNNDVSRYSLSETEGTPDKSYAEIVEEQQNLRQREILLEQRKREATNNPELLRAMDDYSALFDEMRLLLPKRKQGTATQAELDRIEEIKALREERMMRVVELQEHLGLKAISDEETEIREAKETLRKAADEAWAREGAEKENKAIEKAGIPAPEYFRKKALKAFKTTTNFNEAGYMLPDGKLLNFSGGERNHRYRDHREIGEIYEATNGTAALNRFLNDGNIRIMAESPGIDLASGVEPTREQYAALRRFINTNGVADGQFFVDFSGTGGEVAGKYQYTGKVLADRIINDIKYFYEHGKVREDSGLLGFLSISPSNAQPVGTGLTGRDILTKQSPAQTPANYDVMGATPETNIESRIRPNVVEEEAPVAPMPVETAPVAIAPAVDDPAALLADIESRVRSKHSDIYGYKFWIGSGKVGSFRHYKVTAPDGTVFDGVSKNPEVTVAETIAKEYGNATPITAPVAQTPVQTPVEIAPIRGEYEAIRPQPSVNPADDDIAPMPAVDTRREVYAEPDDIAPIDGKRRKWIGTSTESEVVDGQILPDDLDQELIHYQPISNKKTLGNANSMLDSMGYESSVSYMNQRFASSKVSLDDIALGERLIQEAVKRGDTETAKDLIMDISILGTELGQKVQALSIIKRLTPEGQLKMLMRTVERGKAKNDKAFEGVEVTNEMAKEILDTRNADGTYDQDKLNTAVENVKQQIAKEMKATILERINEWRYLSMLGNPKTHIRNLVSNVAMYGTRQFKNAIARTGETLAGNKIERTKTWQRASKEVRDFAKQAASQEYGTDKTSKYSEAGDLKSRRQVLKIKALDVASKANSAALSAEDTWFSKPAYRQALQEYLTANGIRTEEDIQKNGKLIAQAKQYAKLQAQEATFQQDSYIANKIAEIERKNAVTNVLIGSVMPFKKTPINIAKAGLSYSPLGFARNVYDAIQVSKGEMNVSTAIDHFAQTLTGTSLAVLGYVLASRGILNGAGKDDKEGKYDYQLGKQSYSFNFDGDSFSLSWLSPVAMPLFVGANAYEILVEDKDWNYNVLGEALAQTLDPMNEMSFLSSLTDVLSSYDSGMAAFGGMLESAAQSYITSFVPTLFSQIAQVTDDKKRSTKIDANSGQDFLDETWNQIKYKIPGLRQTLEPSTDIWGNEIPLSENAVTKALETFILPYSRKDNIATKVDEEIKEVYRLTGENGVIPNVPYNYINYKNKKYEMTAAEHTEFKKMYGQTAYNLMEDLIYTDTYRNASPIDKAKMMDEVFSYAQDKAKQRFLSRRGVTYTNATKDNVPVYKDNAIKGAVDNDMTVEEYKVYRDNPGKYAMSKAVGGYEAYTKYSEDLGNIKADKDKWGQSISGSRKPKVKEYIYSLDIPEIEKHILFKSQYTSFDTYNDEIVDYLYSREDISWNEMREILLDLGFKVTEDGRIKG